MHELIDRAKVLKHLTPRIKTETPYGEGYNRALEDAAELVTLMPTIEAEPVVHCKDCVYYHKPHVQRKDGTECDISEVPDEYKVFNMCNSDYGINVGGECEYDNSTAPYEDDKTVFRQPDDYCSRGRMADNG